MRKDGELREAAYSQMNWLMVVNPEWHKALVTFMACQDEKVRKAWIAGQTEGYRQGVDDMRDRGNRKAKTFEEWRAEQEAQDG